MKTKHASIIATAAFIFATIISPLASANQGAAENKDEPKKEEPKKEKPKVKPYKLETCIVSDEKLGKMGDPVVFEHEGQEIKLCCKKCRKTFDKDPAKYLKKLEEKK